MIACNIEVIEKFNSLTNRKPGFVIIDNIKNVDIDNEADFAYAEFLLKKNSVYFIKNVYLTNQNM